MFWFKASVTKMCQPMLAFEGRRQDVQLNCINVQSYRIYVDSLYICRKTELILLYTQYKN